MTNQHANPEYAEPVKRMHAALEQVKKQYKVPEGIPAPRDVKNPNHYYSTEQQKIENLRAGGNVQLKTQDY